MVERCRSCRFFVGDKRAGECHRMPPTLLMAPSRDFASGNVIMVPSSGFVAVTADTWCGEFARVANAVVANSNG